MKLGDQVDVRYPAGIHEIREIANMDPHTVMVGTTTEAEAGAIIVPVRRLKAQGLDRWRLHL